MPSNATWGSGSSGFAGLASSSRPNRLTGGDPQGINYQTADPHNPASRFFSGSSTPLGGMWAFNQDTQDATSAARDQQWYQSYGLRPDPNSVTPGSRWNWSTPLASDSDGDGGKDSGSRDGGGDKGDGIADVNSSIDVLREIFDPDFTRRSVTQAREEGRTAASARNNLKQMITPGRSLDEGSYDAVLPQIMQGHADVARAEGEIPLQHELANEMYRLSGEQMAGEEALALAGILLQNQGIGRDAEISQLQNSTSMLMPLLQGLV